MKYANKLTQSKFFPFKWLCSLICSTFLNLNSFKLCVNDFISCMKAISVHSHRFAPLFNQFLQLLLFLSTLSRVILQTSMPQLRTCARKLSTFNNVVRTNANGIEIHFRDGLEVLMEENRFFVKRTDCSRFCPLFKRHWFDLFIKWQSFSSLISNRLVPHLPWTTVSLWTND